MYQLRDYQQQAVNCVINFFKKKRDPIVVVLPTGAGKSLVIAELARIAKGRVLVLAHVKELVEQNYEKYSSYGLSAGIFSASLGKKDWNQKAIFGSVQSVARAPEEFFCNFTLLVIDECHRVAEEGATQYQEVIKKLLLNNPALCILGLTATPYRLGVGWIYEYSHRGEVKTDQKRFFKRCVYELPLAYMIKHGHLTTPVKIDIPVTCYDFSALTNTDRQFPVSEIEEILKNQKRLTPFIIQNVIDIAIRFKRQGVMIFSSSVKHAEEIMSYLPTSDSRLILGDTEMSDRDQIIKDYKNKKFKYLVNVSVLTTGFDAPHVDVIAIMRPTESNSLYQQIVGRGLRLSTEKKDCFILDYTGMGHDIFSPEISDKRPSQDTVPVQITCPRCGFDNNFWGYKDPEGEILEHFGRKCRGATENPHTHEIIHCGFRFRYKICHHCGCENDITARSCLQCQTVLIDADAKLKQAKLSKNSHILRPEKITLDEKKDKNLNLYLEVKYYDSDGQYVSEAHFFSNSSSIKKFNINFLRSHLKRPELAIDINSSAQVLQYQDYLRFPSFIIARKQDKFWRVTEKIFSEELGHDL